MTVKRKLPRLRPRRVTLALVSAAVLAGGGVIAAGATPALAATCTTSSTSGNCGPYSDPAVFRTDNAVDLVTQNDFSAIPQTLTVQDSTSWTVAANTDAQSDKTSVKSYPATQVTYTTTSNHPEPSATFGSTLTSNWTNANPAGAAQDYEYAFDDWLANPANNSWNNDLEVMIWTDNHGQRPAGNPNGQVYTAADGSSWDVWLDGGASSVSSVSTVSFVRQGNAASGSLDRIGFYNWLQGHGLLAATYGVDQLNYGLEVCSAGTGTKTYGVSNYSVVKNGTVGGGGGTEAPGASTSPATNVTSSSATLNGMVNPKGSATTYQFQYGTTTSYGSVAPASPGSAGSGSTAISESANVSGLSPSTTYHYRFTATNATGTTNGADQVFTSAASGGGGTTVAYDSSGGFHKASSATLSWTQTVGSGSNRAMAAEVAIGASDDHGCTITVKDGATSLTEVKAVHTNNQRAGVLTAWTLANPPSGVNTLTATIGGCASGTPQELTGGSVAFTGVSQAAPFGTPVSAFGSGATSSVTTATATGDMLAGFAANGSPVTSASAPSVSRFIENQDSSTGAGNSAGATSASTGSSVTMSWAQSGDWWGAIAVQANHA